MEQELRETKQKLQKADEKARGLSWSEALSLWHTIFAKPRIRPRYQIIRANHCTTAKGRRHPKQLRHWNSFHRLHKSAFTLICNQLAKTEAKAFESRQFYQTDAQRFMSNCILDNEVALVAYEQRTVEELVIGAWERKGSDRIGFKSRQDHSLDDVTSRLEVMNTGSEITRPTTPKKHLCYITTGKGPRRDLFVTEYKAADKLTPNVVLEGLHDMEIDAIIQRIMVSTEEGERREEMRLPHLPSFPTKSFDSLLLDLLLGLPRWQWASSLWARPGGAKRGKGCRFGNLTTAKSGQPDANAKPRSDRRISIIPGTRRPHFP